eukprot:6211221-Pleurochrysis_carterae.AAC.3
MNSGGWKLVGCPTRCRTTSHSEQKPSLRLSPSKCMDPSTSSIARTKWRHLLRTGVEVMCHLLRVAPV